MPSNVWSQVLSRIETKVTRHSFYTWFRPTVFVQDSGEQVTIRVPNELFRDWLTKHYAGVINEAVAEAVSAGISQAAAEAGIRAAIEVLARGGSEQEAYDAGCAAAGQQSGC